MALAAGVTIFDSSFLVVTEAFNCTGTGFAAEVLDELLFRGALTALAVVGLTALAAPAPRLIGAVTLATAGRALGLATTAVTGSLRLAAFTGAGLTAVFAVVFGAALPTATLLMTGFALSLPGALD